MEASSASEIGGDVQSWSDVEFKQFMNQNKRESLFPNSMQTQFERKESTF